MPRAEPTNGPPHPPRLPAPEPVPHVFVQKGLGTGKTHGLHLLEEVVVPTPGLSRADAAHHRLVRLSVNDREHVNDQLLAGFRPNPYPQS